MLGGGVFTGTDAVAGSPQRDLLPASPTLLLPSSGRLLLQLAAPDVPERLIKQTKKTKMSDKQRTQRGEADREDQKTRLTYAAAGATYITMPQREMSN